MPTRQVLWRVTIAALCASALATGCSAEQLSLQQAVDTALRNSPLLAAGMLDADAARYAAQGARALRNPDIGISPSVVGEAGSDSAILFTQPLELNGSRRVRARIAASQAGVASHESAALQRDVVRLVKLAYWEIVRAREIVRLNQDNVSYIETLRSAVQKQREVGATPGSQVIKTDVELARANQELAHAQLDLAKAVAALGALLNVPADRDLDPTDSLTFVDTPVDMPGLQALAQQRRPEIAGACAEVDAALGMSRAAKLQTVPDLAIQARKGEFAPGSQDGIAIVATLPIIDWGSAKAERKRTEAAAQSRRKSLEAVKRQVVLDVNLAARELQTSSGIVREYQKGILDKSDQLAQMARKGYEKGATNYLEVLEAQRTLRSTRAAYYSALADNAKAIAQLEWAVGCDPSTEVKP